MGGILRQPSPSARLSARRLVFHIRRGLRYGYPPCCVLRWSIGNALGEERQALKRGVCNRGLQRWVPCRPGAHGGRPFRRYVLP